MGNCSSEHHAKLFRAENFSNDPTAFRVFVKKKNKFIPGWLKINDDEIVFTRGGGGTAGANNFQFWPLAYLRRYGFTCSGIFFFESGRRCATGEGLHTFQSHQAEKIFHLVQERIKVEEYARGSRASSVVSNNRTNLINNSNSSSRIHPIQRFCSEGLGSTNEYRPTASPSIDSNYSICGSLTGRPSGAPPPYDAYQRSLHEALARRICAPSPANCGAMMSASTIDAATGCAAEGVLYRRQRLPSTSSAYSANVLNSVNNCGNNGMTGIDANGRVIYGQQQRERPRSVVSAMEHNVCANRVPQMTANGANDANIALAYNPMTNGANLFDRSFNANGSAFAGCASPWLKLEGEIVQEHVLSKSVRKYNQEQLHNRLPPMAKPPYSTLSSPPLATAIVERKNAYASGGGGGGDGDAEGTNALSTSMSASMIPSAFIHPQMAPHMPAASQNVIRQRKYHSYVNVDLPAQQQSASMSASCHGVGSSRNLNAARELHRTNKSRQEFLSSQPGGFVFGNSHDNFNNNSLMTSSLTGVNGEFPPRNFPQFAANNSENFSTGDGASRQQFTPMSAFTSFDNSCGTKLRKRIPQLPVSPGRTMTINSDNDNQFGNAFDSAQKQNYASLNFSRTSTSSSASQQNYITPEEMDLLTTNIFTAASKEETAESGCRTNYALIDYNKTRTLQTVTNIKQQMSPQQQQSQQQHENVEGAFV